MSAPENESPPAGGAAEGRRSAVGATGAALFADVAAAGKHPAIDLPPGYTRPPVWTLQKHDGVLLAGEREFRGRRFFELRLWVAEGRKPTAEGVTMPPKAVAELARALAAYAATLAPHGAEIGS